MKDISLDDARLREELDVDPAELSREPVRLRRQGEPFAAVVPLAEYEAFRAWRDAGSPRRRVETSQTAFERERAAYLAMEPQLRREYDGRYVAIHQGQVVDSDPDEAELLARVVQQLGSVPLYVRKVGAPLPTVRIPSPRLVES